MSKVFLVMGSILSLIGVAAGAFGAHGLRESLSSESLHTFEIAVRYQMYHSFALIVAGWALDKYERRQFVKAGWLFLSGVALFSGSLYILVLTGAKWLGAVTPFGGWAFLTGWFFLAKGFWKLR
ncbi:MAG TPA: DUF423 domain-containing protein [Bacteroidota bacterium]